MSDEYATPRDLHTDLAEITSRLGEPEAVHRTNRNSVIWRFVIGVLIVLAVSALHYVMWSGIVPWPPARLWKVWALTLVCMFIVPGVGLYLINFAVRGLKLWALVYPTGLFVWHRGSVLAFPWDEIRAVQIAGLPDKAVMQKTMGQGELPDSVWFDLEKSRRRVFGTTITLTRSDGEQVSLFSTLDDFPSLGERVQRETFRRLFRRYWADLMDGVRLEFGPVACDHDAISVGKEVKRRVDGKSKSWGKCELNEVVNLHVLMGVVQAMRA
jgi:hypothetical protein